MTMACSIVTQQSQYKPLVLVDTAHLSREEWLSYSAGESAAVT